MPPAYMVPKDPSLNRVKALTYLEISGSNTSTVKFRETFVVGEFLQSHIETGSSDNFCEL